MSNLFNIISGVQSPLYTNNLDTTRINGFIVNTSQTITQSNIQPVINNYSTGYTVYTGPTGPASNGLCV